MDQVIIFGVDSIVGANIAATLSDRYQVTGISRSVLIEIEGCDCQLLPSQPGNYPEAFIQQYQPSWVIHCGPASRSAWFEETDPQLNETAIDDVRKWAIATNHHQIAMTLISSDAVFTGPWMFQDEQATGYCPSQTASIIRTIESEVTTWNPNGLIVRTNAYGWTPNGLREGWIEQILDQMSDSQIANLDGIRCATPIHASDLADILHRTFQEEITGLFHIGGAERVTQLQFVRKLADQFDANWLTELTCKRTSRKNTTTRPVGFGCGETSLQTKKVRKALCVAMPMLSEGLERLHEQKYNGYQDAMQAEAGLETHQRAA